MLNEKTSFEVQTFLLLTNQGVTLAPTTFLQFFPCMEETQKSSRSSEWEQILKKTYRPNKNNRRPRFFKSTRDVNKFFSKSSEEKYFCQNLSDIHDEMFPWTKRS